MTMRRELPPESHKRLERMITSGVRMQRMIDQLLDVIAESLGRLESKLQGETPQAQFLWDRPPKGVCSPKDENALSDYVKGHFDDDEYCSCPIRRF